MSLKWDLIEAKLREIGWSHETLKKAAAAYAEEREAESRSHLNGDLNDQSMKYSRAGLNMDGTAKLEDGAEDGDQELTREEKRNILEKMKSSSNSDDATNTNLGLLSAELENTTTLLGDDARLNADTQIVKELKQTFSGRSDGAQRL